MKYRYLLQLLFFSCSILLVHTRSGPFVMRMSCGSNGTVRTPPTDTVWFKDFGYTGGAAANATRPSFITPPLDTLRYFPLSDGPENCYSITGVPRGRYAVRIFFGIVGESDLDSESLFDVSVQGTLIYSLNYGWSSGDPDRAFLETIAFFNNGTASLCFHSTGHGDPAIMAIEMLQLDDKAYNSGPGFDGRTMLRTAKRISCGSKKPKFGSDYDGSKWGGDRYWSPLVNIDPVSDRSISTAREIKQVSDSPNFYPPSLYQTALVSTEWEPELTYSMEVEPNRNYSVWLHFAEIDDSVTEIGERMFDVIINGAVEFANVDVIKLSGGVSTSVVLNKTLAVHGKSLTITLRPTDSSYAIINAVEVFELIPPESTTSPSEVKALRVVERTLGLPPRFGWKGDPCAPPQHTWGGVDCHLQGGNWVIDGLALDNQGLMGYLPEEIGELKHLRTLNLSGNGIGGTIPFSLGNISTLEMLVLSYNSFNGSIPDSFGRIQSLKTMNLNGNSLTGRVPSAVGAMLLRGARANFSDNGGLCGIPGLVECRPRLSAGAKTGVAMASVFGFASLLILSAVYWKRRQNILRARHAAAREAPYAKSRMNFARDVRMASPHKPPPAPENTPLSST